MSVTIGDVVQDALGILGEVTGVGTQLYSEPRMIKDAGRAFNMLFKKHWWRQYCRDTVHTLDGSTGTVTDVDPFTQVLDFEDFRAVYRGDSNYALPTLPEEVNASTITGTSPRFWTSKFSGSAGYAAKKITIYPLAATGTILVRARYHPLTAGANWTTFNTVHMDRDLLACGTAYMALSGDDLNPQAKADVQSMMDGRYKDIQHSLANQKTAYSERPTLPTNWFTNPY